MARAVFTPLATSRTAVNLSAANKATIASADGTSFKNTGKELLYLENTDAGDVVVTVQTGETRDGNAVADPTWTLQETGTAADIVVIGPFPTKTFNQGAGMVYVDVDTDAVVKCMVLQMTQSG